MRAASHYPDTVKALIITIPQPELICNRILNDAHYAISATQRHTQPKFFSQQEIAIQIKRTYALGIIIFKNDRRIDHQVFIC